MSHDANTSDKAGRFIDWLVDTLPLPLLDPETFKLFGDAEWHRLYEMKNETAALRGDVLELSPPNRSRSAIIVGLREHQRCAADPFVGLPS